MYVSPVARQANIVYITGIGHGAYDSYTGDFYDAIFSVGNCPTSFTAEIVCKLKYSTIYPCKVGHGLCKRMHRLLNTIWGAGGR